MKMIMGGKPVDRPETIDVINPFDGSLVDTVPRGSAADVKEAIAIAVKGYEISRRLPAHKRIDILLKAAAIMKERHEELARTIAQEGSKTIREARGETTRAINTITISGEEARRLDGETIPFDSAPGAENKVGYYYRFPIGIIGCITPFNDPLNLVAHKLGPAIAGGNSVVLKPATVTPLSALLLGAILLEAGLPGECLSIITGYGSEIGDALVTDPRVRMISFTGGVEAGEIIASKMGMKKVGMELGSNAPVIVMDDCDLPAAVASCVSGAFWAVGQNCIGVQRLFVHEKVYDAFRDAFVAHTRKYKVGYQLDEDTDMGPMIEEKEAARVIEWVRDATDKGATLLTGGTREGTLVQPTVLENMPDSAILHTQEVFGPTVTLYRFSDLSQAIDQANAVDYGLHGAIFTNDLNNAFLAIKELDVGSVMVNESTDFRVDLMPFGGVKKSGLGREGIRFSLQEMTEPKVVCFNLRQ
ncbi:MAG: aldehyde dehydrogenase family protein [Candidatus Delongbacteria bacterium]|nr:aldehyde dehydrogenase family protein [Candidatus Delongbacteria bacterium]